jgi:hypothetical protein
MGWTIYNGTFDDAVAREFACVKIVRQAKARSGARVLRWILAERDGHRWVSLAIGEREDGRWAVKIVDESCGPNETDCPLAFLDGLPAPVGFGAEWRERVRAYHATKAPPIRAGDTAFIRSSDSRYHNKQAEIVSLRPLDVRFDGWQIKIKRTQLRSIPW